MNKKFLIIVIIITVAVVVLAGVWFLFQAKENPPAGGQPAENSQPKNNIQAEVPAEIPEGGAGIEINNESNKGVLLICVDKCGDQICQKSDPNCDFNTLGCTCSETAEDCPQDCR